MIFVSIPTICLKFVSLPKTEERMITLYAAPLQGFTEAVWRNAHAEAFGGIDAYYSPFVRLEKGNFRNKDRRDVAPENNRGVHLIPQLVAGEVDELCKITDFLVELGYRKVDVNMGCPFPLIANRGKGSGILPYPDRVGALLKAMERYPQVAFSVKMRLGWQEQEEWKAILPLLNDSCVHRIVLHPRIGKQQYKGEVNTKAFMEFYRECRIPLVYNGDLCGVADMYEWVDRAPDLCGLMLGRGLLANPSLADEFRTGHMPGQTELYRKVEHMHMLMVEGYRRQIEGGEAQLLGKLKTMWEYLLPQMDKKARKAIVKSNRLDGYLLAVENALRG